MQTINMQISANEKKVLFPPPHPPFFFFFWKLSYTWAAASREREARRICVQVSKAGEGTESFHVRN